MPPEAVQTKDPLDTINQSARERSELKQAWHKILAVSNGTTFGIAGTAFMGGAPDIAYATVATVFLGYMLFPMWQINGLLARMMLHYQWVGKKELQSAYTQLQEDGLPEPAEAEDDLGQWARHGLAQQIRRTKLFLAQKGKLDQYQEFKWLQTVQTPEWLKPTQTEVDEVDRYFDQRHAGLNQFVNDQAERGKVIVECGNEISAETTRVYLFKDPRKNPWDHRSFPLIDVMRGFAARDSDLQQVGIKNAMILFSNPKAYEGIHSIKGRQRVADFFRRPVVFYEGAEYIHTTRELYGVKEPTVITVNSLPEHLYRLRYRYGNTEPCSRLIDVEPTAMRAGKIGLVLART